MKYFKLYSVFVIVLSLVVFVSSFYMFDILPVLYKVYTGHTIESSKILKLQELGSVVIHDIRIYSSFTLLTFLVFFFVKNNRQYFVMMFVFLIVHFVFIAEIGEFTVFRRLYQFVIMLPLIWIFFEYFPLKKISYYQRITHSFLYITLLCIVFPGIYFPPFFNGIGGWTDQIDKTQPITISGVFLVRKDNKEVIYSRSIVNPINFPGRINSYLLRINPKKIFKILEFYEKNYKERYPFLKREITPNQKLIGKFAYPGHNPYGKFDYNKFPPNSIKAIKISTKYYTWDKKFIEEKIIAKKDWK